jgi:hypothetical protein
MQDKEIPTEIISIRYAWLKAIDRVAEAIARRYREDVHDPERSSRIGQQTLIESVIALKCLLVDFGECPIKTEVNTWYEKQKEEMKKQDADEFKHHLFYRKWFEFMVETLNKYGLLFDTQPKGYSNVVIEEILEEK